MFTHRLALAADPGGALRCRPATRPSSLASCLQRLAFCTALLTASAHADPAGTVTVAWNPNPEPDIAGYELSYGTATGSYTQTIDAATNLEATVTGLNDGTIYYFAVTAINAQGLRSPFSDEVIYYSGYGDAVPTNAWTVRATGAANAFDGNAATLFLSGPSALGYHDLEIDMGGTHSVEGLRYLPRQDASSVGNIAQYEIYLSQDGVTWGNPISTGTFSSNAEIKEVRFAAQTAAFIRLRSLSQATSDNECAVAEMELIESSSPGTANRTPVALAASYSGEMNQPLPIVLTGFDEDSDPLLFSITSPPAHGTLSGTPPTLLYTPSTGFFGKDSFSFQASDGRTTSAAAQISISLAPGNRPPTADPLALTTPQNVTLPILLTGSDPDGNAISFSIGVQPEHGVISGAPPNLTYTPALGFVGMDRFTFSAYDGIATSPLTAVTISVVPAKPAPQAIAQSLSTSKRTPLAIQLTGTGENLNYTVASSPANGTLSGTLPFLTYSPSGNFVGSDSFSFRVNDGLSDSAIATVAIFVKAINTPPIASSGFLSTSKNVPLPILLTAVDSEHDPLTFQILTPPSSGILTGTPPNLIYTPRQDFHGTDSFSYKANDGQADSLIGAFLIQVTAANAAPVAASQAVATTKRTPVSMQLAATDGDQDPLTYIIVSSPKSGIVTGTAPNLTYTPTGNFTGTDSFTFKANDGTADSAPATVSIEVKNTNDAPVAIAQTLATVDGTPLSIALTATDADADPMTFAVVHPPNHGTLSGTVPYLTYLPAVGYFGNDSLTFQANDGTVNSAVATVTIEITKPATLPGTKVVSRAGWSLLYIDSQEPFDGLGTYAFDGDPATSWHTEWRNGTLPPTPHEIQIDLGVPTSITGFQYLPRQDQFSIGNIGSYEFYVSANSIDWGTPVASGTFENSASEKQVIFTAKTGRFIRLRALTETSQNAITCVAELNVLAGNLINGSPVAVDRSLTVKVSETPVDILLAGSDPDGSPLSFAISTPPLHGTLSGTPPHVSYLPYPDFGGVDQFTYRVNDGAEYSAPATVTITVIPNPVIPQNHAPYFPGSNITLTATQGTAFDAFLIASDPDARDSLTFKKLSGPSWLRVSPQGILSGTPTNADTGVNTFSVKVSDPSDASDTTTLTITVANSNDAPAFQIPVMTYPNGTEKLSYTGQSLAFTASDADGADTISYSKVSGPEWLTIAKSGDLSGTPPASSAGLHIFTIRATDTSSDFADATLQIQVYPNNLPLPWNLAQLGTYDVAGSAKYSSGIYTISGAGALSSTMDSGNFAWQTITKDGEIIARVSQLNDTGENTRVGLMLRESLSPSARQVFMGVDAAGKYQFARRATIGGAIGVATRGADANRPIWLRLNRKDGMITGYKSNDGTIWTKVGSTNVKLKDACYLGLGVSSGNPKILNTSKFSNVRIIR